MSLIAWIKQWVGNVVALVFLAMLLELLLPRGNMQRFVRVVMGLLVMLAVLQPVFGLVANGLGLAGIGAAVGGASLDIDRILADAERLRQQNSDLTMAAYRRQIERDMELRLARLPGVTAVSCSVDIVADRESADYKAIAAVTVTLVPGDDAGSGPASGAIAPIAPVTIGQPQAKPPPRISAELRGLVERTLIVDYGLTAEQITVTAGDSQED